jgi:hypothetical protein
MVVVTGVRTLLHLSRSLFCWTGSSFFAQGSMEFGLSVIFFPHPQTAAAYNCSSPH